MLRDDFRHGWWCHQGLYQAKSETSVGYKKWFHRRTIDNQRPAPSVIIPQCLRRMPVANNSKGPTSTPSKEQKALQKAMMEKHAKKLVTMNETALQFYLKQLCPDMNPRTRRDTFLPFKNTVKVVLEQHIVILHSSSWSTILYCPTRSRVTSTKDLLLSSVPTWTAMLGIWYLLSSESMASVYSNDPTQCLCHASWPYSSTTTTI